MNMKNKDTLQSIIVYTVAAIVAVLVGHFVFDIDIREMIFLIVVTCFAFLGEFIKYATAQNISNTVYDNIKYAIEIIRKPKQEEQTKQNENTSNLKQD